MMGYATWFVCTPDAIRCPPRRSSIRRPCAAPTPCPAPAPVTTRERKTKGRKRHLAVDTMGLLLAIVVTAACIQDRDGAHRLLVALRARLGTIGHVWTDGGYAGGLLSWAHQVLSFTVDIVKRTDTISGFLVLHRRWVVERTFGWITKHRRCVRDYETLPQHHEAMITMITMSRRLAPTGDW
jgi:transposase